MTNEKVAAHLFNDPDLDGKPFDYCLKEDLIHHKITKSDYLSAMEILNNLSVVRKKMSVAGWESLTECLANI